MLGRGPHRPIGFVAFQHRFGIIHFRDGSLGVRTLHVLIGDERSVHDQKHEKQQNRICKTNDHRQLDGLALITGSQKSQSGARCSQSHRKEETQEYKPVPALKNVERCFPQGRRFLGGGIGLVNTDCKNVQEEHDQGSCKKNCHDNSVDLGILDENPLVRNLDPFFVGFTLFHV